MTAQSAIGVKVGVTRGQNGKILEVKFMHHPGIPNVKSIMEKTLTNKGSENWLILVDGIMVFSSDGKHVPVVSEQKGVLEELYKKIKCGQVCLMPLQDGFFEGIVVAVM